MKKTSLAIKQDKNTSSTPKIEQSPNISSTPQTEQRQSTSDISTTVPNTNSAIVYVTNTGSKYHKDSCSYLKKSKIQMSLSEAQSQGYTACSKCY